MLDLLNQADSLLAPSNGAEPSEMNPRPPIGWRGLPSDGWKLQSTLSRLVQEESIGWSGDTGRDHELVRRLEIETLGRFTARLGQSPGRVDRPSLGFGFEGVLPVARHHGLPVRALDWTWLLGLATYLATESRRCDGQHGCGRELDGCIWRVNFEHLDIAADSRWPQTEVPTRWDRWSKAQKFEKATVDDDILQRMGLFRRAPAVGEVGELEQTEWLCGLYFERGMPRRMELQQGFFTVSNRIRDAHDEILDRIDPVIDTSEEHRGPRRCVPRGRIVIPSSSKAEIRRWLALLGIDAETFGLPLHDELARRGHDELRSTLRARRNTSDEDSDGGNSMG
jgi:hypothetical protein